MSALSIIRTSAWAAIAALGLAVAYVAIGGGSLSGVDTRSMPFSASIGGPFKLVSHDGKAFTDKDLAGKPYAIFFGFTDCPDICPTTLLEATNRMKDMGPLADKMRFVFVSVDPEKDTAQHLKTYMSSFDPRIVGLTGTAEEVNEIVARYRIVVQKVPTKSGYTINHTATTYLMDARGRLASTLAYEEPQATQLEKLKRLVSAP
jgi:protein SCO1